MVLAEHVGRARFMCEALVQNASGAPPFILAVRRRNPLVTANNDVTDGLMRASSGPMSTLPHPPV